VILAQVEGSRQVRSTFTPGQIYPALQAAAALLQATPTDPVVSLGYALVEGADSLDLALPVCRDGRHSDAVLLLSAPAYRWSQQKLLDAFLSDLRAMAARLSYQLGAALYAPFAEQSESWTTPAQPSARRT